MNQLLRIGTAIGALVYFSMAYANETATVTSTPAEVPAIVATPTPVAPLTEDEKKKLRSEYKKALSNQKSAFAHQEKSSMKELYSSTSLKQKKWREEQKKARQLYFDQNMSGPARRDYVQAYLKKKEAFDAAIKVEISAGKKAWQEKTAALKATQKENEAKFNESLNLGVRPAAELWPTGN